MPEDTGMQIQHTQQLTELVTKVNMLEKIFEITQGLHMTLVEMAGDNKAILLRLEQQGDAINTMVTTLKAHEDRFDRVEEKMGSKDTVNRLMDRMDTIERKEGKKAENLLGQIKWLLITLVIGAVFALVWANMIHTTV